MRNVGSERVVFEDPPFTRYLFNDTRFSWAWFLVRLYIGYTWLASGLGKVTNPGWTQTGESLRSFWQASVAIPPAGKPPITFDWYRDFILFLLNGGHYVWFAKLVVVGELLIGTALILGAFVGIFAFLGAFMNWNFLMAGASSVNPVLFTLSILLVVAWKTAGWLGADRWLLPLLGTPWRPGVLFAEGETPAAQEARRRSERERDHNVA